MQMTLSSFILIQLTHAMGEAKQDITLGIDKEEIKAKKL
jgi:hypothetical protein